jgi:hypothetical protein
VRLQRRAAVHAVVRGHANAPRRRRRLGSPPVTLGGGGRVRLLFSSSPRTLEYLHIYHHYDVSGIKNTMSVTHVSVTQCKMSSIIMVNM